MKDYVSATDNRAVKSGDWMKVCTRGLLLAALVALWAPLSATALDPSKAFSQYVQTTWGLRNGLTPKTVNSIAQTGDGYLWLATEDGLIRFDGRAFETFDDRNSPGLGERLIRSLAPTPEGGMWIGTMTGLVRYEHGEFRSLRRETYWEKDIYDLAVSRDGSVWFSSDSGLRHVSQDERGQWTQVRNFTRADGLPTNDITALHNAADGSLWIGTRAGLVHMVDGKFTTYPSWQHGKGEDIVTLAPGLHGDIWVGTDNGSVGHWSKGILSAAWEGRSTSKSAAVSLTEDSDGTVWVAFQKLGLGRLRGGKLEILTQANGLPSVDPDWVFEDRERNLWVGWADAGLSMIRDGKFLMFGKVEGLDSDVISSLEQAPNGDIWVGTADAGLNRLTATGTGATRGVTTVSPTRQISGLGQHGITAILQQRDGTFWAASGRGEVTRIVNGRETTFRSPGNRTLGVAQMVEDDRGEVWFGFNEVNGLARLRQGKFEFVSLPGTVKALAIAPDGSLWIASYLAGLIHYKDRVLRIYTQKDGLSNLFLTSVHVDADGTVWAGTFRGGLNRLKDGVFTRYSTEQGLSDSTVGAMVDDGLGFLWLSGARGIMRVARKDLTAYATGQIGSVASRTFNYNDGLRADQCNFQSHPSSLRDRDGRLWFATYSGLAMIDPARIREDSVPPLVRIESVTLGDRPLPLASGAVEVRNRERNLSIRFSAPTFVAPERMQILYRMSGLENKWAEGDPETGMVYARLAPGHYVFELEARNSDGLASTQMATLKIDVLPRLYETWWFRVLMVLLIGTIVWSFYAIRMRYMIRKTADLEELIAAKTSEVRTALEAAEAARESLRDQATHDFLTGIWNRRAIFEILDDQIQRCEREQRPLAIIMADIDHFKNINDTWGHPVGDQVIREVALRICRGVRRDDAVGRFGGEELLILLPGCGLNEAMDRAEALRIATCGTPFEVDGLSLPVSCSFGLAHIHPGTTSAEIVGEADAALYLAKRDGRNCVRLLGASQPS